MTVSEHHYPEENLGYLLSHGSFWEHKLGLGSLIPMVQTGGKNQSLAPVSKPYCQQRGAVFDYLFFFKQLSRSCQQTTMCSLHKTQNLTGKTTCQLLTISANDWFFGSLAVQNNLKVLFWVKLKNFFSELSAHLDISHFCSNLFKKKLFNSF